ncbi:MAG: hypothetical protein ABI409_19405 [Ramlibacter sp.]
MASKARSVLIESGSELDESQQGAVAAAGGAQMPAAMTSPALPRSGCLRWMREVQVPVLHVYSPHVSPPAKLLEEVCSGILGILRLPAGGPWPSACNRDQAAIASIFAGCTMRGGPLADPTGRVAADNLRSC